MTTPLNQLWCNFDIVLEEKSFNEKFSYSGLNAPKLVAYELCKVINVVEAVKNSWDEEFNNLKTKFSDYVNFLGNQSA